MKKIYSILLFLFLLGVTYANPITKNTAQKVAINFYSRTFKSLNPIAILAYTEYASDSQAVYYVFNVNTKDGFVIVSADDAAHPILGCSNIGNYITSVNNNNVAWWMNCRKQEIVFARAKNIAATSDITNEWMGYENNSLPNTHNPMSIIGPLMQTTWDQDPNYNAMCPGGSVTGCVATAMAQIMKYWSYPPNGHGSSGYWDEQAYSYQNNYGFLFANYDTSKYVWSAMPLNVSSPNNQVAKLMYDCGVSVDMDYGYESGSWVITGDYPVCSQASYVKYFGYNPKTIQGLYQSHYTFSNWTNLIENELNNGRPVQYVGWDSISPNNEPGHTWVCDGYNSNTLLFHMNWGWSGGDDGWFSLNALNAGGYQFNWWNEALIGIEPPATSPYFVGTPTFGCKGMTVQFTDQSIVDSNLTITLRKWLLPGGTPSTSTAINPSVVYNTTGTYNVTEIIGDARGTDTLVRNAYISVDSASPLSVAEGFESPTFPPTGWAINNPNLYSYVWQLNTSIGGYGNSVQSMYFNNCQGYQDYAPPGKAGLDIIGQRQQIYTPEYNFTSITKPEIYFDVAYAPYNSTFSDTLVIYYSTDCGATFTSVYSKGGLTLGTTGSYITSDTNSLGCFLPSNNQWRTDTIHISAIAGLNNVMFSFENRSGNGSPLYVDNINIPGGIVVTNTTGISSNPSVSVYPNPNNGTFAIALTNISGSPVLKIYNVLGQIVNTYSLKNDNTEINLSSQPNGIYIYRVFSETGSAISTGRLIID